MRVLVNVGVSYNRARQIGGVAWWITWAGGEKRFSARLEVRNEQDAKLLGLYLLYDHLCDTDTKGMKWLVIDWDERETFCLVRKSANAGTWAKKCYGVMQRLKATYFGLEISQANNRLDPKTLWARAEASNALKAEKEKEF